jgi:S-layer protein (TIGR01567 family)
LNILFGICKKDDRAMRSSVAIAFISIIAIFVAEAVGGPGLEIRSSAAGVVDGLNNLENNSFTWNPQSFAGFYYDLNDTIGNESLKVVLSGEDSRKLSGDYPYGVTYTTIVQNSSYEKEIWGNYKAIGFLTEKHFAGYNPGADNESNLFYEKSTDKDSISKHQLEKILIDSREEMTLASGKFELGEGYEISIKPSIRPGNPKRNKIFVTLYKKGAILDSEIIYPSKNDATEFNKTYYYKKMQVGNQKGLVIIGVHIKNVTRKADQNLASIDGIWQISDTPTEVETDTPLPLDKLIELVAKATNKGSNPSGYSDMLKDLRINRSGELILFYLSNNTNLSNRTDFSGLIKNASLANHFSGIYLKGTQFGIMTPTSIDSTTGAITMNNIYEPINLTKDKDIELMPGVHIKAADNDTIRFLIYISIPKKSMPKSESRVTIVVDPDYETIGSANDTVTIYRRIPKSEYVQIRGAAATGNFTWNPQNFAGFFYDLNDDLGRESLKVVLSGDDGRTLSGNSPYGVTYTTLTQNSHYEKKNWGTYKNIVFLNEKYFVGYNPGGDNESNLFYERSIDKDSISKYQLKRILIDSQEEMTTASGTLLRLDEGYELVIKLIDIDENKIYLELTKGGTLLDTEIISPSKNGSNDVDKTYYYISNVAGRPHYSQYAEDPAKLVTIAVHFRNPFRGANKNLTTIDGIWQISDTPKDIEVGNHFENMTITGIINSTAGVIIMNNMDKPITLTKNSRIVLMPGVEIETADNDSIRFYIYKSESIEGASEAEAVPTLINATAQIAEPDNSANPPIELQNLPPAILAEGDSSNPDNPAPVMAVTPAAESPVAPESKTEPATTLTEPQSGEVIHVAEAANAAVDTIAPEATTSAESAQTAIDQSALLSLDPFGFAHDGALVIDDTKIGEVFNKGGIAEAVDGIDLSNEGKSASSTQPEEAIVVGSTQPEEIAVVGSTQIIDTTTESTTEYTHELVSAESESGIWVSLESVSPITIESASTEAVKESETTEASSSATKSGGDAVLGDFIDQINLFMNLFWIGKLGIIAGAFIMLISTAYRGKEPPIDEDDFEDLTGFGNTKEIR